MISNKHPRVSVFTKPNGGKGTALNLGIKKSKCEIVLTMDADTFAQPDSLRKMIGHFYSKDVMCVSPSMGIYQPKTVGKRVQQISINGGFFEEEILQD
jgi:cellulose synthase/poly-beta-1,6-N-acetylglucosamine synthase-like glycosyltransferase